MKMNQLAKLIIVTLVFTAAGFVRPAAQAQTCTPPPSGLVAWYPGDGNVLDYQGDSNGTLRNGATFAPGIVGQAFSFDGNSYVDASDSNLPVGNSSLTISAWINTTQNPAQQYFVSWGSRDVCNAGHEVALGIFNQHLVLESCGWHAESNAVVNDGAWHHVVGVWDSTSNTPTVYVDGNNSTTIFTNPGVQVQVNIVSSGHFNIGQLVQTGLNFSGLVDEVQVFNRALSAAEIQAIFNAGSAGQCKPPLIIQPLALPDGIVGSPYNQIITAGAGTGPYTFNVSSGSLPTGLSLSNGGTISGTSQTTGSFNFTVQATDSNNVTAQRAYSMSIVPGCITPPSGLVGWYPGDGNAVDIQGGDNGTLQNGATFAPGKVGQAFSFNGAGAEVTAPNNPAADPANAGSIEAWVRFNQVPSAAGHGMHIFSIGDNPAANFDLTVETNNNFRFYVGSNSTFVDSTTTVQTNVWYHVAATWDSTIGLQIYVNGALENTNSTLQTRTRNGSLLRIGNYDPNPARSFNGLIDELSIYGRLLTASEVQAIFNAGIAGKCKSPSPNFCGVISGQITDAQGPLAGALVQACEPNNGPCSFNATTDAIGNYQITGLPVSTPFDLTVFPPSGSVDVPGELLGRTVQSCGSPLANQNVMLQPPAPPAPGTSIEPSRSGGGGVPVVYWHSPLTLTTTGCPNVSASYVISRGFSIFASGAMTETPAGSGTYTASVPALSPVHGAATVAMTIACAGGNTTTGFDLYIDPSGTVQDPNGAPISGATVTLFRSDTASGPFTIVPDGDAVMSPGNRRNPDTTDAAGQFGWDVLAGFYKVRAEKGNCAVFETDVLQIPPPVTDLVLTLACPAELISAASQKTHGMNGTRWPLPLSLGSPPTVECRSGGPGGNHTLVLSFNHLLVGVDSVSASATSPSGPQPVTVDSASFGQDPHDYIVNVSGVPNAQYLTVTLNGVHDEFGEVNPAVSATMGVLLGAVDGRVFVDGNDVAAVQSHTRQSLGITNFPFDVDANGFIDGNDVSLTQGQTRTRLP